MERNNLVVPVVGDFAGTKALRAVGAWLKAHGATTAYWKTGHSYIKRYSHETKALVGFEKSGHFFFNPPLGRGYDDGLIAALAV